MALNEKEIKKVKTMYSTARQFKNAILESEMLPTAQNNYKNKIFPFIVNKSFACEIYLKTILKIIEKPEVKSHNLKKLSEETGVNFAFKKYLLLKEVKMTEQEFDEYLTNISNSFEEWRYIYEKEDMMIRNGFLNMYCEFLDEFCKQLMIDQFKINVDKELMYI